MIHFRDITKDSNPERFILDVLPLLYESGKEYFDCIFGNQDTALESLDKWMRRASSEFAILRWTMLFDDDQLIGGIIGIDGEELLSCQKADTFALLKEVRREDRKKLISRMAIVKDIYLPVKPKEFFVRTIAVKPEYRGKGIGGILINKFIDTGYEHGFNKFRLEVRAENIHALKLFKSVGFCVCHESINPENGKKIVSMLLEKSKL